MKQYQHICIAVVFLIFYCSYSAQKVEATNKNIKPYNIEFAYALDTTVSPTNIVIEMLLTIDEDYYTYTQAEKEGLPTKVIVQDISGRSIQGKVFYPQGELREDILNEGKVTRVYTGEVPIFIQTEKDALTPESEIHISLLLCSNKHCMPVSQSFPIILPSNIPRIEDVAWEDSYLLYSNPIIHTVQSEDSSGSLDSRQDKIVDSSLWNLHPQYLQASLEPTKIELAILFGFLAGLILNIMPCVLPVLTLKFSFILSHSNLKDKRCFRYAREQNIFFAAGILSWFLIVALGVESLDLAWGGFFQSTPVVYGLMIIVFVLSLSLFDFFTLPVIDFKIESTSYPRIQAYLTGVITTLLATPCSGPLLGGVLGWVILQSTYIIFIVFFATGLGMALPYLLFAVKPQIIRFLPKPGAWCRTVEKLVGFFLLGTTCYLLSILPQEMLFSTIVTLLFIAFAMWCWGTWGGLAASSVQKIITAIFALSIISLSIWWNFQPSEEVIWDIYAEGEFRKELGTTPMLLEFTADWCPTCKLLEKTVLTPDLLEQYVKEYGIKLVRVDLTHKDVEAETLLRALGSVSIPVTAIFPTGDKAIQPFVLRDIYTSDQLEYALKSVLKKE